MWTQPLCKTELPSCELVGGKVQSSGLPSSFTWWVVDFAGSPLVLGQNQRRAWKTGVQPLGIPTATDPWDWSEAPGISLWEWKSSQDLYRYFSLLGCRSGCLRGSVFLPRSQPHAHRGDRADVQRAAEWPGAAVRAETSLCQLRVWAADVTAPLRGPGQSWEHRPPQRGRCPSRRPDWAWHRGGQGRYQGPDHWCSRSTSDPQLGEKEGRGGRTGRTQVSDADALTSAGDAALLSLQACASKGAEHACSPPSPSAALWACLLCWTVFLVLQVGSAGLSTSCMQADGLAWVPPWTKAVGLWVMRACSEAATVQLQTWGIFPPDTAS